MLKGEKMYRCYYPSDRPLKALLINTILAIKALLKEKPDLIISSGTAPAIPFLDRKVIDEMEKNGIFIRK